VIKPFVRITALVLAALFLTGAAFAWVDLLTRGNFFTDPLLKPAAGFLVSGLMFLALGLRGLKRRRPPTGATAANPAERLR
jgi:hypothetical protein